MANKSGTKQTEADIERLKGIAVAAGETVYHYKLIARSVNRDEDTILSWRTNDEQFSDRLEQARIRFIEKKAKLAKPEFLLERLEPEIFQQRSTQDVNVHLPKPLLGGASTKKVEAEVTKQIEANSG